eukprot:366245-Chlamydomonas_euryale.AAC.23
MRPLWTLVARTTTCLAATSASRTCCARIRRSASSTRLCNSDARPRPTRWGCPRCGRSLGQRPGGIGMVHEGRAGAGVPVGPGLGLGLKSAKAGRKYRHKLSRACLLHARAFWLAPYTYSISAEEACHDLGTYVLQTAIRPYIMDLGTTNGTFLNGERIEGERFYELLLKVCLNAVGRCWLLKVWLVRLRAWADERAAPRGVLACCWFRLVGWMHV